MSSISSAWAPLDWPAPIVGILQGYSLLQGLNITREHVPWPHLHMSLQMLHMSDTEIVFRTKGIRWDSLSTAWRERIPRGRQKVGPSHKRHKYAITCRTSRDALVTLALYGVQPRCGATSFRSPTTATVSARGDDCYSYRVSVVNAMLPPGNGVAIP